MGSQTTPSRQREGSRFAQMDKNDLRQLARKVPDQDGGALSVPRRGPGGRSPGLLPPLHDLPPSDFPQQPAGPAGSGRLRHHPGAHAPASGGSGGRGGELPQLCQRHLQQGHAVVRAGVHHLFPHAGGGLPDDLRAAGLPPAPAEKSDRLYGQGAAVYRVPAGVHRPVPDPGHGGTGGAGICGPVLRGAGGLY